jgi:hypothetical protein
MNDRMNYIDILTEEVHRGSVAKMHLPDDDQ